MKKIFFNFLIFLLITNTAYSNQSSATMTVTVKVIENYEKVKIIKTAYLVDDNTITISNKTPLIFFGTH